MAARWGLILMGMLLALPTVSFARNAVKSLERRLARLEAELARRPMDPGEYRLPTKLTFCGETIDLRDPQIRERVELHYLLHLGRRAQINLWIKRARRVFPVIEAQARKLKTCEELKYLAAIESSLRPAATSRASAKGWWQFMAGTGRQYGLDVDRVWDERADLAASTKAALTYLSTLKKRFGTWSLAMAAYNTGPNRLRNAQRAQGVDGFWRLDLYDEAENYVPKIIALKVIMEDLPRHGFRQGIRQGWPPIPKDFVRMKLPAGREIAVVDLARGAGIDLRLLKSLNPELGSDSLPVGTEVALAVPKGKDAATRRWLAGAGKNAPPKRRAPKVAARRGKPKAQRPKPRASTRSRPAQPQGKPAAQPSRAAKSYTVRRGDSLWSVAQEHKVSVGDLRRWNKLDNRSVLKPGQRLVVRPGA